MPIILRQGTVPKKSEQQNQDRARISPKQDIAAVADGAGGRGVFVGEWAEMLLDELPPVPFENADALYEWLKPIATRFFEKYEPRAQKHDFTYAKFLDEGSAATLTAAWVDHKTSNVTVWIYGDSPAMRLLPNHQTLRMPPSLPNLTAFSNRTQHLNWNADYPFLPAQAHCRTFQLQQGETILLATDALAQFILIRYLLSQPDDRECCRQINEAIAQNALQAKLIAANREILSLPFADLIAQLLDSLSPNPSLSTPEDDSFKTLLYGWFDQGLIEEDDYTLLSISHI